jgi:hypothetical protein
LAFGLVLQFRTMSEIDIRTRLAKIDWKLSEVTAERERAERANQRGQSAGLLREQRALIVEKIRLQEELAYHRTAQLIARRFSVN